MAEDITHPGHNPFDAPRKKRNNGVTAAIIGSVIVHGVVGVYLWKAKFQSEFKEYSDDVTDVAVRQITRYEPLVLAASVQGREVRHGAVGAKSLSVEQQPRP